MSDATLQKLQKLSLCPGGFERDLNGSKSSQFRNAAWLYLLYLQKDLAIPNDSPRCIDQDRTSPFSQNPDPTRNHVAKKDVDKQHSKRKGGRPINGNARAVPKIGLASEGEGLPVDTSGWQIGGQELIHDEWRLVETKKSRRKRKKGENQSQHPSQDSSHLSTDTTATVTSTVETNDEPLTGPSKAPQRSISVSSLPLPQETENQQQTRHDDGPSSASLPPHRDEEQVDKDIRRSFVGTAFSSLKESRNDLRTSLSDLVVSTLRQHPTLSYFQGYHDILTIFLLTLSASSRAAACSRLSLHFIRDSMTLDLTPIMGQLKLLRNILRLADVDLARRCEQASALPFFAIAWLLTLFSHDLTSISLMQRMFDFLLAHGPLSVVYLCAAVVLSKRQELETMADEERDDPAMLHLVLSRLPHIFNDDKISSDPDVSTEHGSIAVSKLLHLAAELMNQFPFDQVADGIMGPHSVLITWSQLSFDHLNWHQRDSLAERIVQRTESIVLDPNPDPILDPEDDQFNKEKRNKKKKKDNHDSSSQLILSSMVIVISITGVLFSLYLYPPTTDGTTTDQIRQVLFNKVSSVF